MKKLIGDRLEDVFEAWFDGLSYLISDDLISFYTFFTVIFAECFYLWAFYEVAVAIPFTVILLGYVLNVIVGSWLKGWYEGERKEVQCAIIYVIVFAVLFVIGCFFNVWLSITITVIPFAITAVWIRVRFYQDTYIVSHHRKIVMLIGKLFANKAFWLFSQFVVIGGPFIAFVVCLGQIPTLVPELKIIIPIVYAICIPFIAYYEDDMAACNVFELAYDITWDEEYEKRIKNLYQRVDNEKDECD